MLPEKYITLNMPLDCVYEFHTEATEVLYRRRVIDLLVP
jgi:hypothetical protein